METREAVRRRPEYAVFLSLLEAADDAADELEDAAFLLDLETRSQGKPLEALQSARRSAGRKRRRNGSRRSAMPRRSAAPPAAPRPRISWPRSTASPRWSIRPTMPSGR